VRAPRRGDLGTAYKNFKPGSWQPDRDLPRNGRRFDSGSGTQPTHPIEPQERLATVIEPIEAGNRRNPSARLNDYSSRQKELEHAIGYGAPEARKALEEALQKARAAPSSNPEVAQRELDEALRAIEELERRPLRSEGRLAQSDFDTLPPKAQTAPWTATRRKAEEAAKEAGANRAQVAALRKFFERDIQPLLPGRSSMVNEVEPDVGRHAGDITCRRAFACRDERGRETSLVVKFSVDRNGSVALEMGTLIKPSRQA
jgi:hypothetical protein